MCVVSMVGDFYREHIPTQHPYWINCGQPEVSRAEFEALKKTVQEMLELMRKAKEIDNAIGQPDCELAEKMALLRQIAAAVGVDLSEVVGGGKKDGAAKE